MLRANLGMVACPLSVPVRGEARGGLVEHNDQLPGTNEPAPGNTGMWRSRRCFAHGDCFAAMGMRGALRRHFTF